MKISRIFIITIIAIIFVLLTAFIEIYALQINLPRTGELIYSRHIRENESFFIVNIHSVELCKITEYFKIDNNYNIILYEATAPYSSFGLPYTAFGDEKFILEKDLFRVTNMSRLIPEVVIFAEKQYENTIYFRDGFFKLYEPSGYRLVRIYIEKMPVWKYALGRIYYMYRESFNYDKRFSKVRN